jgi:acetyl-CoA acetyltransferase
MSLTDAHIPYGAYWSSPFVRWDGRLADHHPLELAADTARTALAAREVPVESFSSLFLGTTVPSRGSFYGAPWLAGMLGDDSITGPTFAQACATSARVIAAAAQSVQCGDDEAVLCIAADRTSHGPIIDYPAEHAAGENPEKWVWDSFMKDPYAKNPMLQTAENVASRFGIDTERQHEAALLRWEQYQTGADMRRRYLVGVAGVTDDEGMRVRTAESLAEMTPVRPDGTVTAGSQTHPADGNAGMVITTRAKARELSSDPSIEIRLLAYANARTEKGHMPMANIPAVGQVLDRAGIALSDVDVINTHNPFAVNDVLLADELDIPLDGMNRNGSSLIWGHPQGPTGMRSIIEVIEELVERGGGTGLFTGCAAGDTAAAVVLSVS